MTTATAITTMGQKWQLNFISILAIHIEYIRFFCQGSFTLISEYFCCDFVVHLQDYEFFVF